MFVRIKEILKKYQEMIRYLIIGVLTTVVSLVVKYALLFTVLDAKEPIELQISIVVSWFIAVIFAYVTNRTFVFKSENKKIIKEILLFFSSRIVTLLMESVILWFFITYLKLNTNFYVIIWTLLAQVIVIVGNYILSKFLVFTNKSITLSNKERWFYIFFFILVLILCYFFPYTHDDWDWGSITGLERLQNGFSNFNGRWVGNTLGMLLTRVRILRAFAISFTLLGCIILVKKIINKENNQLPYFIILLILLMPIRMFAQSFAWTVGFANYVPVVLIALFIIYKNKSIFQEKREGISNKWIVPFLLLGFIGTLFMEHLTIYLVVLGIFLIALDFFKNKKVVLANIFYFIGTIAGSALMFSNTGYRTLFGEGDGYRSIENGNIFLRAFKTYFESFKDFLVHNNFALNLVIIFLLFVLVYQYYKKNAKKIVGNDKRILNISIMILGIYLSYIIYLHMIGNINIFISQDIRNIIEGVLILFYTLAIILIIIITIKEKTKKFRMLFEIGSIAVIALPLLIVTPIGPRCFFPTYFLFVVLACELFDVVTINWKGSLLPFMRVASFTIMMLLLTVYGYSFLVEQKRVSYIEKHKGEEILVLPKIPNEKYMQHPDPRSDWFRKQFRQFYNIKEDVTLEFIDYRKWRDKNEK